ncbi:MAG TPA: paraquat-inducible protein A [Opitutaceae bacterium]|nr:paraquat-inducible protein A [Opitutaceae bacterium]
MPTARSEPGLFSCRHCGCVHHEVPLQRGERAVCFQCGSTVGRHSGGDAALAFAVTGLILMVPALEYPVVIVRKFGIAHSSYIWSSVRALWHNDMALLSIWVALCGLIVPVALLASIVALIVPSHLRRRRPLRPVWRRVAVALAHWSIPEVQVLAILVAFVKIGALVNVDVGTGLWFYGAAAGMTLLAWRQAETREQLR